MHLKGVYQDTLFRNEKTGYTIFTLTENSIQSPEVICSGYVPGVKKFAPLVLKGENRIDEKGRDSFAVEAYSYLCDLEKEQAYILSVKGMTKELMDDILLHGESVFRMTKDQSEQSFVRLIASKKKNEKTLKTLYQNIKQDLAFAELYGFLRKHGGWYDEAKKLFCSRATDARAFLKQHPYAPFRHGELSFYTADSIAKENGFGLFSKERAQNILYFATERLTASGNTCMTGDMIAREIRKICHNDEGYSAPYILSFLTRDTERYVISDDGNIYIRSMKNCEESTVRNIKRIQESAVKTKFSKQAADRIASREHLSEEQKQAIGMLDRTGIKIITGGPGCGKTTTIRAIIQYIKEVFMDDNICLMSPTGCAAQHMAEATGCCAQTINSRLGYIPYTGTPQFDNYNPLPFRYYIIDEFSMTDLLLASKLFAAIPPKSTVIIIGDPDQLPSVGAGNVLEDMIESGFFPVCKLTKIFRQKESSLIIENARKVNRSETDFKTGSDFHVKMCDGTISLTDFSLQVMMEDRNCQMLCPMRRKEHGSKRMNVRLQELESHIGEYKKVYGDYVYYEGDSVITIRNVNENNMTDGRKKYFNGQPGIIKSIDTEGVLILFDNQTECYIKNEDLGDIMPSRALTIHKSQGNEYERVLIICPRDARHMLTKRILYTAITRAKKEVILVLEENLELADETKRKTRLSELLYKAM